ncbi:MAG TPA: nitroreductase family protein [Acidimicrobiales bacterium]|nr:nitroreductase family protein [Acidimicrobiales bacterium]
MADPAPLDFFTVVDTQRAIRRFRPDLVPDDALRRVLEAATRAPSARGAEPWFFVVARDAALRARIAAAYRRAWEAARTVTAQADLDADLKDRPHYARMMRGVDALARQLATVPVLIACCLDHRQLGPIAGPDGTLRSPCAAYASIFPAVQNLLLAARALGLGTTLTTLHRGVEDELAAALAIPPGVEVAALVPLGYPADHFGPTRRKSLDAVAFLDGWGRPLPRR